MSTPKKPTSTVHKPNNLEPTSTPPSLRARRRAHNLRHSDSPPQTQRSNSGTLRVVNASSDTDSSEEYGQAITPQLDEMAVQKLPPRLQRALRSLQEEREARAATPTEGDSLATLRTTALGSHPPTDDECAFARRLKRPHDHGLETSKLALNQMIVQRDTDTDTATCAGTGELPVQATRHRLRPALKRARSFIGLNTLRAKKVAGETVTQGLGAAKKWAKGLTRKGRGEGVVEEVIEGDEEIEGKEIEGGKEEEGGVMRRKVDLGGTKAQRMTVRGALESYI